MFDRYGRKIKILGPFDKGWDGKYESKQLPSGDYWYIIELNDGSGRKYVVIQTQQIIIFRECNKNGPRPLKEILSNTEFQKQTQFSRNTIVSTLKEYGIRSYRAAQKPRFTDDHKRKKYALAKKWKKYSTKY